ncbi:Bug family tripartite tricarboxylate transporter substrate binding protein [Amaricoccus sp. W119]|uniref:Bug family tripartite tricarboxylate transporter substrate binding protein n=1 Tax=Amaricoccus sp. W119 TaxID=3391833 RepID=UPI0039A61E6C
MSNLTRRGFALLATAAIVASSFALPGHAEARLEQLGLLAPSSPGSGYDQLARGLQQTLQSEGLVPAVEVTNVAGGGGTVGLAQFVTSRPRNPVAMVVGFALVGGVLTTGSAVTLDDVTPVARLMADQDVIVVPEGSEIRTLADLVAALKAAPGDVSWAGGSIGGVDHITAGLFAKAAGVDPTAINYVVHAGGGEVLASVLGGHTTLGISGYEEFRTQIEAGKLVPLAVSGEERIPGLDAPTFREAGVDLAVTNWRGLVTSTKLDDDERAALDETIAALVATPAWAELLASRNWQDAYQPADAFGAFLDEESTRIGEALRDAGVVQ